VWILLQGLIVLETSRALNTFLAGVEQRAFRMANYATRNPDDACDIVQDAMLRLADRYADKAQEEWAGLFFRILQRRILDWHRRQKLRRAIFNMLPLKRGEADDNAIAAFADEHSHGPVETLLNESLKQRL